MKNTLLVFVLIVWSSFCNAQIIDIPDPNFKNALVNTKCVDTNGDFNGDADLDENNDGEIALNETEKVYSLVFKTQNIENLSGLEYFKGLSWLHFSGNNNVKSISISNLLSLKFFYSNRCSSLNSLEFNNLPNLKKIESYECSLNKIKFMKLPNLIDLDIDYNNLISIDLSEAPSLKFLNCRHNKLTNLDLSELKELYDINLGDNLLEYLFIKNGKKHYWFIGLISNPTLKYICCDEFNKHDMNIGTGSNNPVINSYCSFKPGSNYNTIIGKFKYGKDLKECNENNNFIPFQLIKATNTNNSQEEDIVQNIFSDSKGNYVAYITEGTNKLQPIIQNINNFNLLPEIVYSSYPQIPTQKTQDFCITPKGILKQVDLSIIPLSPPARPGFDAQYKVVITNKGNQVENGTLHFAYDEARLDFVYTDVNPSTQSDGLLSWDFTDLFPFETRYYNVTLNVNSPSETPPVNAGDELLITCNILDNVFLLKQEVVGSYDPNDKTCLEGKTITPEQVGEYVHYLIRFENTGNFAAENVVVKDVIDASTFDISTLQIVDASHEAWARINGNIVEFIFENIQLPFDDATNDGYISFKIKTKESLELGHELKNEANIYFDYNLPILTNTTNTVVAIPTSTDEAIGDNSVEIFPNPVSDILRFLSKDKIVNVEIFDISGRLVLVSSVVDGEVDVERLESGAYQLKVYTKFGVRNGKIVKI